MLLTSRLDILFRRSSYYLYYNILLYDQTALSANQKDILDVTYKVVVRRITKTIIKFLMYFFNFSIQQTAIFFYCFYNNKAEQIKIKNPQILFILSVSLYPILSICAT